MKRIRSGARDYRDLSSGRAAKFRFEVSCTNVQLLDCALRDQAVDSTRSGQGRRSAGGRSTWIFPARCDSKIPAHAVGHEQVRAVTLSVDRYIVLRREGRRAL